MLQISTFVISLMLSIGIIYFSGLSNLSVYNWFLLLAFVPVGIFLLICIYWSTIVIMTLKYKKVDFTGRMNCFYTYNAGVVGSYLLFAKLAVVHKVGFSRLRKDVPQMIVFNHSSDFDSWVLYKILKGRFVFVAKASIKKLPVLGNLSTAMGTLFVDRDDAESGMIMVDRAVDYITKQNTSIVIAPEGTRNITGKLLPFKHGGFHIALRARCPIVLIGLKNTEKLYHNKPFRITHIEARVINVIRPEDYETMHAGELSDLVRDQYLAYLGQENE